MRSPVRPASSVRPSLEALEDRLVPSTVAGNYSDGVWRYDTAVGWTHLTNLQASQLDVDDSGNVYGKFSNGIWRWNAFTGWALLSNASIETFQVNAAGVFYGDFGSGGVWRWHPTTGWSMLSGGNAEEIAVSDTDSLFASFATGSAGTWRWAPGQGWWYLSTNRPNQMQTDDHGNLVGLYNTYIPSGQQGTWRWNPLSGWFRMTTAAPQSIEVCANGTIFENRGSNGIWRAAPNSTFVQIGSHDATSSTLFGLPDGGLYEDRSNGSGSYSGWYWNGGIGFVKIINETLYVYPAVVGKDGDLFFDSSVSGASGTGYWSLQVAYALLSSRAPTFLASQS